MTFNFGDTREGGSMSSFFYARAANVGDLGTSCTPSGGYPPTRGGGCCCLGLTRRPISFLIYFNLYNENPNLRFYAALSNYQPIKFAKLASPMAVTKWDWLRPNRGLTQRQLLNYILEQITQKDASGDVDITIGYVFAIGGGAFEDLGCSDIVVCVAWFSSGILLANEQCCATGRRKARLWERSFVGSQLDTIRAELSWLWLTCRGFQVRQKDNIVVFTAPKGGQACGESQLCSIQ